MAAMSAQDFVLDVLVRELAVAHVVVGADFLFGRAARATPRCSPIWARWKASALPCSNPSSPHDGAAEDFFHATSAPRSRTGRPEEAANLLGHWWSIEGHVAHGDKRGRALGFPTANLSLEGYVQPKHGIYAVRATVEGEDGA